MTDYNLSGLSARSFEQMIQALSLDVIGPNTTLFGDGPDGGREASFDGPSVYRIGDACWNGYGVIQAKFLQRTKDTHYDGSWAVKQLAEELKKFPKRKVRRPKYYIFATNVTLSAVEARGAKDRLTRLLQQKSNGFDGFDIWDYGKICAFLDNNRNVATAYAAWVTPGDVLSTLLRNRNEYSADFENTLATFLQKELLADQHAHLEQAGHSPDHKVFLANVFVDVPISDVQESDPSLADFDESDSSLIAELTTASSACCRPSLSEATSSRGRYVIVGGPGQGKSTACQYLCQLFRAAILEKRDNLLSEVRSSVDKLRTSALEEQITLPSARRFPIRIVLSLFAQLLSSDSNLTLFSFIRAHISKKTNRAISDQTLRHWLGAYPWLVLLDGLDEVPASSNRDQLMQAVIDFLIDANEVDADLFVVATTRPQGYTGDFSPSAYSHRYLTALNAEKALHYARRLTSARYDNDDARRERVYSRLEQAARQPTTARLMESPLQVTIMATLLDRAGQPPEERWGLFREYYKTIYDRELERQLPSAEILRAHRVDIDALHHELGLILQTQSEEAGKTDARMPISAFKNLITRKLSSEGHTGSSLTRIVDSLLEAAAQRLVFIVGVEQGQVGFEIRSLQEFMAAEAIMSAKDEQVVPRLRAIAFASNWRNVFFFASGRCFADRQYLRDNIVNICSELNVPDQALLDATVLTGSQLALELLEDGVSRTQPRFARQLADIALKLALEHPREMQRRLAAVYSEEVREVYEGFLTKNFQKLGPGQISGAWMLLLSLAARGVNWALKLRTDYWPQSELEYETLPDLTAIIEIIPDSLLPDLIRLSPPRSFFQHRADQQTSVEKRIPKWCDAAIRFTRIPFHFSEMQELQLSIKLDLSLPKGRVSAEISRLRNDRFKDLLEMPHPAKSWLPMLALVKLITYPSQANLAEALVLWSECSTGEWRHWHRYWMPWTMQSILERCQTHEDLQRAAGMVNAGEAGDVADWEGAEARWQTRLVEVKSVKGLIPFSPATLVEGPPSEVVSIASVEDSIRTLDLDTACNIVEKITDESLRAKVAGLIAVSRMGVAAPVETSAYKALRLLEQAARSPWLINLDIVAWENYGFTDEEACLLHEIGCKARDTYARYPIPGAVVREVEAAYERDINKVGLLRILASLPAYGRALPIGLRVAPSYAETSSSIIRQSVLAIRLLMAIAEKGNSEILEICMRDIVPGEEYTDRVVKHAAREGDLGGPEVNVLCQRLQCMPADGQRGMLNLLTEIAKVRRSRLYDQRSSLGLDVLGTV